VDIAPEDFSQCTLQEVIVLEQANHARSRDIRKQIRTMVQRRLANSISFEEYAAGRKIARNE
jgi:hypothetical protein